MHVDVLDNALREDCALASDPTGRSRLGTCRVPICKGTTGSRVMMVIKAVGDSAAGGKRHLARPLASNQRANRGTLLRLGLLGRPVLSISTFFFRGLSILCKHVRLAAKQSAAVRKTFTVAGPFRFNLGSTREHTILLRERCCRRPHLPLHGTH